MKPQRIGEFEITRVAEIERMALDPNFLFGNVTPELIAAGSAHAWSRPAATG